MTVKNNFRRHLPGRAGTFRGELPQRQRNVENAAVVEEEQDGNAVQKACSRGAVRKAMPQRQRNAENGAVVEEEQDSNAVQKACSRGVVRKTMPQRQRNAENAAVVEEGGMRWENSGV